MATTEELRIAEIPELEVDPVTLDIIEGALKSKKPTVCIHVDVLNFDSYADTIGIARSEDTVRSLGQWLLDAARVASGGGAFVGHIGGSDFIAVLSPEHVEQFVASAESTFDDKRATFPGDAASLADGRPQQMQRRWAGGSSGRQRMVAVLSSLTRRSHSPSPHQAAIAKPRASRRYAISSS